MCDTLEFEMMAVVLDQFLVLLHDKTTNLIEQEFSLELKYQINCFLFNQKYTKVQAETNYFQN